MYELKRISFHDDRAALSVGFCAVDQAGISGKKKDVMKRQKCAGRKKFLEAMQEKGASP